MIWQLCCWVDLGLRADMTQSCDLRRWLAVNATMRAGDSCGVVRFALRVVLQERCCGRQRAASSCALPLAIAGNVLLDLARGCVARRSTSSLGREEPPYDLLGPRRHRVEFDNLCFATS